jgi:GT2 family glycosyltransferase
VPLLRFISVNFDGAAHTGRLLDSVAGQDGTPGEFSIDCIIVDNSTLAARAMECERMVACYPFAKYIKANANLGYFNGLNCGLAAKVPGAPSFVVICNNDLRFGADFCRVLLRTAYPQNALAICPDLVTTSGYHQNPHILTRISWLRRLQFDLYFSHFRVSRFMAGLLRLLRRRTSERPTPPAGCELHMGVGACYVLTSGFLERFERLHFPFFLYGEEAFFSEQIHASGGVLWFDPDLHVTHDESASLSLLPNRAAYEFARRGYPVYRRLM